MVLRPVKISSNSAVNMRHLKPRYWKLSGAMSRSGSQKDTQSSRQEVHRDGYNCPEPTKTATWARFRKVGPVPIYHAETLQNC
ncbi:hypothetical protein AVEN_230803-1 [Araneus ventricosus]|uniref:Uncharacterized protein n=1 Tax=Araneus ventricosus TaxID=182803 RepID=A0A4Y2A2R9_ARAVE|nr:hypothetical protein AVEN_230803-1 [Araneus ventricosus]